MIDETNGVDREAVPRVIVLDSAPLPARPVGESDIHPESWSDADGHSTIQPEVLVEFDVPKTGDSELDQGLLALAASAAIPVEDQLPVIEALHRGLQDRLADAEG